MACGVPGPSSLSNATVGTRGNSRTIVATGETFEQAWYVAEAQDREAASWSRRRALLRSTGLTFTVEEETGGERTRLHGRLGVYRYTLDITR